MQVLNVDFKALTGPWPPTILLVHATPAPLASKLFVTPSGTLPSQPLHFLFPLPRMLFLQKSSKSTLSLLYSNVTSSVRPPSSTLL